MTDDSTRSDIHVQLSEPLQPEDAPTRRPSSFDSEEERADFWRDQFQIERERLAKLWVAYQDLRAQRDAELEATESIATEKAGEAILEEANSSEAEAEEPADPEEGVQVEEDDAPEVSTTGSDEAEEGPVNGEEPA